MSIKIPCKCRFSWIWLKLDLYIWSGFSEDYSAWDVVDRPFMIHRFSFSLQASNLPPITVRVQIPGHFIFSFTEPLLLFWTFKITSIRSVLTQWHTTCRTRADPKPIPSRFRGSPEPGKMYKSSRMGTCSHSLHSTIVCCLCNFVSIVSLLSGFCCWGY